jgi:hypothetical protein
MCPIVSSPGHEQTSTQHIPVEVKPGEERRDNQDDEPEDFPAVLREEARWPGPCGKLTEKTIWAHVPEIRTKARIQASHDHLAR